jgi:segregation and condensation protein B
MNDQYARNVIEAALLAAGRPVATEELVTLFDERDGFDAAGVHAAIEQLRAEYETRGLELKEVASGFRVQIRAAMAQPVSRLWQERPAKYSRAEIEQIRGVAVNPNIIKTLLERSWIRVVGHRDVPGKPELLGTTRDFLDYFSLQKLDDLPTLAQLKELEDLRVQLTLPGADAILAGARESAEPGTVATESPSAAGSGEPSAENTSNSAAEDEDPEAASADAGANRQRQGLVAGGAFDDRF